ncbi:MAG: hypothetical protein AM326_12580 [Candidatus Thorarchaeota archaeon SMTZ-45]|nr:MAG: hypothetical protein AM326_12580 [Candidatus Thorarchaeota archaeon SMTZ-45]
MVKQETWERVVLKKLELPNGMVVPTYGKIKAGVVVTGFQYVMHEGQAVKRMISNSRPSDVEGLKRLVAAIHASGGLAAAQLVHCGSRSLPRVTGIDAVFGPSEMDAPQPKGDVVRVKAMTVEHIERVTQAYANAAKRAVEAGFDLIELHGAHNYGLWQFFDPSFNKRPVDDPFTGLTIEGRCKAMVDAVIAVRRAVDIPIQVKVNSSSDTVSSKEVGELAKKLAEAGAYCIIISGPNPSRNPKDEGEAYFFDDATVIQSIVRGSEVLVGLVGGIRSPETVVRLLTGDGNSQAAFDVVQLSRPLISEPALLSRWTEEAKIGNQEPARCISCNHCLAAGLKGKVRCVQFEEK